MQYIIIKTITMICSVLETAAFIYCLLSWIAPQSGIYGVLEYLLEPFVRPFRPLGQWIMEKTGIPLSA